MERERNRIADGVRYYMWLLYLRTCSILWRGHYWTRSSAIAEMSARRRSRSCSCLGISANIAIIQCQNYTFLSQRVWVLLQSVWRSWLRKLQLWSN